MHYILTQLRGGLRGLVTVGICAAAVATTNSALNAMSWVLIQDFYRPWRERRGDAPERHYVQAVTVLLLQPGIAHALGLPAVLSNLSFPFQLCLATLVAFAVCAAPAQTRKTSHP